MNRFDFDWQFIRCHTLLPVLTAAIAASILIAGIWVHDTQQDLYAQISVSQDTMHDDYNALVYRRRLVDRYHRRYQRFHELGFVGRESRLDWIETLRETMTDLTLPSLSYTIEPQLRVVAPVQSILAGDDIAIHLSRLHLELGLVHEIDLLRFFDELQRNAPGLIKVDGCDMSWQADESTQPSVSANILADCSILIFSVVTSDVAIAATSTS